MQKIKEKFLKYYFSRSIFLRKITFSIVKNNKLRIFYSSLLLLFASFLISISINLPVNIENYKNIILKQNFPYKSVVYYQSNPYNSPNFSFYGKNNDSLDEFKIFDKSGNINKFIHPTYDTYDPSETSKYHLNGIKQAFTLSFLSGQVWDKAFINQLNSLSPFWSLMICKESGDPNKNDKAGDCVTWMIKKNAPGYISSNLNDPNFALTFGAVPFEKNNDELFTSINGVFEKNYHPLNIWGINFNKTRLKNLKKYKNIFDSYKNNKSFLPVLINKTVAKNYNLKINDEFNFNYSYPEVQQKDNQISIDKIEENYLLIPSVHAISGEPSTWKYDGKINDLKSDADASTFSYNNSNYFYLTSKYAKNDNDEIKIKNINKDIPLKVIGITNDYGYSRFYTEKSLLNNLLEPPNNINGDKNNLYHDYFQNNFFNAKLSTDSVPRDYKTYEVYQPYDDYSPIGLNGGTIKCSDGELNFNQNGLGVIDSLFSNEMFNNAYNSLLIALSILFILIICLAIAISLIIVSVTNSNILQDNKKNLFVMKALGYTDNEINKIISKIYSYILFIVFFVALLIVYFSTIYALNFIFTTKDIFVPATFKLWEIPVGLILLFIIYYINKIISFNIIKKLTLSTELKK